MDDKVAALNQNRTWTTTELTQGKKFIGYKARLVAKGFTQIEGIDFFDANSHFAELTTVIKASSCYCIFSKMVYTSFRGSQCIFT